MADLDILSKVTYVTGAVNDFTRAKLANVGALLGPKTVAALAGAPAPQVPSQQQDGKAANLAAVTEEPSGISKLAIGAVLALIVAVLYFRRRKKG